MRAVPSIYGWSVADPAGGRWWPDASAQAEIDSAEAAIRLCETAPMRGEWRS